MAKKNKAVQWIIVIIAVLIVAYILYRQSPKGKMGKVTGVMDDGCYPLEEVHETDGGQTWISIIPFLADGVTTPRPPASATSIGNQFVVSGTGSALDGIYTINSIYYDVQGNIGSLKVDTPSGYNFNYNATQGGGVRDMTYFGIGRICLI